MGQSVDRSLVQRSLSAGVDPSAFQRPHLALHTLPGCETVRYPSSRRKTVPHAILLSTTCDGSRRIGQGRTAVRFQQLYHLAGWQLMPVGAQQSFKSLRRFHRRHGVVGDVSRLVKVRSLAPRLL